MLTFNIIILKYYNTVKFLSKNKEQERMPSSIIKTDQITTSCNEVKIENEALVQYR